MSVEKKTSAADPRQIAFEVLRRVDQGAYADLTLDARLNRGGMAQRDRALATELVYGVLRQRGRLDFALSRFCQRPLTQLEADLLAILRLGAYQLLCLDRVPARAAVHESVELARRIGLERLTGFINGVLRSLDRGRDTIPWPAQDGDPLPHLIDGLSLPPWLAKRWLAELGAGQAQALGEAMLQPPPFALRANTLRIGRDQLLEAFRQAGHSVLPTSFAPEGLVLTGRADAPLPGAEEGWFQVQDEASMLIAHLLQPQAGEAILDGCSAPGGKTTHMAALTGNASRILALDLHPKRLELVRQGAARLGCQGIDHRVWDLTGPPTFLAAGSFDRVLVDAPCSGLGVLRRNPESRWRRIEADIVELARLQRRMLENVAPLLRPGGVLVYSLCTITPEETEGVVEAFLAAHDDYRREDLRQLVPEHWQTLFDERGALRTFPHRHGGMDAFYAVRLRRK
jgi:16S rRNA (cytosine967-C5)-methyltransferase